MNRPDWEDVVRSLQRNVDPNHLSCFNNSMGHSAGTDKDWDTFYKYPRYTVNEPHGGTGLNVGWETLVPPPHNIQNKQSSTEDDPDGEPLEMDSEDPELARKRKELREIEEQIIQKKVALALKKVEPFVKKTVPGFSGNEDSATCIGETLQDRVNVILQQRHSLTFLSKVQSPKERIEFLSRTKGSLLQEDHPLKLRVKALIKQRCTDHCVLPTSTKVFDVTLPSPSQNISSPAKRGNTADKGFQRFLSVLNKGVDMNLLSRIVNDDSDDLPLSQELLNIQCPVGNKPDPPFSIGESQRSNSGTSLLGPSQTGSGEVKTKPPSRERANNEGVSLPGDEDKKNDRGDSCFGSSNRSKSPASVKKKKKKEEEEEKPKLDEQREQLQNILKTLGLNLEVEEMSKLADRTQERLYGKKHEGRHNRREQGSQQRASHRQYRNSSSSSRCSSSSSRSTSRSYSPSPSRRRRSHSRDSKPRLECERSRSRDRSRDRLKNQVGIHSKEGQKPRDRDQDGKVSQKFSAYEHPSEQINPHLDAFSLFPDHTLSQYSPSTTFHSGTYSTATDSCWTYTQSAIPAPLYSIRFPNPQNTYHHFPGPNMVYPGHNNFEDMNLLVNPDLSTSEGQTGSASGLRCLQVVSTTRSAPQSLSQRTPCLKQLTKGRTKRGKNEAHKKRFRLFLERKKQDKLKKRQQKVTADQSQDSVQTVDISQDNETEQSEDVKQPTEEEIKANLRKKLEAFNQKAKQKLPQPVNSQLLQSVECQDCL